MQYTHKEWLTGVKEIQLFSGGVVLNNCSTNSIICLQQDKYFS